MDDELVEVRILVRLRGDEAHSQSELGTLSHYHFEMTEA